MTGWAHVTYLRVADGAHDKIFIDRGTALRTNTVVRELMLAQSDVKVLLFAINKIGAWTQNHICKQAHNWNNRDDRPQPPRFCTTTLRIAYDIDDRQHIQHNHANEHEVEHHHDLGGDELVEDSLHVGSHSFCNPVPSARSPSITRTFLNGLGVF